MKAKITKIYGPPGTGKTHTVVQRLRDLVLLEPSNRDFIYAISYTKSAVRSLKNRVVEGGILSPWQVRSWHSFLWGRYGLGNNFMSSGMKREFFKSQGLFWSSKFLRDLDDDQNFLENQDIPEGNLIEASWSAAIMTSDPISFKKKGMLGALAKAQLMGLVSSEVDIIKSASTFENFVNYMKKLGKFDYIAAPYIYLHRPTQAMIPWVRLLVIDEAQDLSPLMWDWERRMTDHAEEIWLVGDDDQAILNFLGASNTHFVKAESHKKEVLSTTYRFGADLVRLALTWIDQAQDREKKLYEAKKYLDTRISLGGDPILESVAHAKNGSVFLLARHRDDVRRFSLRLKEMRIRHSILGQTKNAPDPVLAETIIGLCDGSCDYSLSPNGLSRVSAIYGPMKNLPKRFMNVSEIIKDDPDFVWAVRKDQLANFKILSSKKSAVAKFLNRNFYTWQCESDHLRPRISVGTIHSSKGLEADTVVLHTDCNNTVFNELQNRSSDEIRVWYVGITRARKNLVITGPDYPRLTDKIKTKKSSEKGGKK